MPKKSRRDSHAETAVWFDAGGKRGVGGAGDKRGTGAGFLEGGDQGDKVSGNIYMLQGAGGNIGASIGEDGIVIVDDQIAPLAEKIQASLKSLGITNKPVRFVINTHYHGDHTGGNALFSNAGSVEEVVG